MNKGQVAIETEIAKIKKALLKLGCMHPGSLSQQKRSRGGSPRGDSSRGGSPRGGIYYQLSYSHAGKGHTKYVRPEDVPEVTQEIENYRGFRKLTGKWVELAIELAKLRRDEGRLKRRITEKE